MMMMMIASNKQNHCCCMTVTPMTSGDTEVQLVSGSTDEYCTAAPLCVYNVSDVVRVQLQVNSSSGDWLTVYQFDTAAPENESWTTQFVVRIIVHIQCRRGTDKRPRNKRPPDKRPHTKGHKTEGH